MIRKSPFLLPLLALTLLVDSLPAQTPSVRQPTGGQAAAGQARSRQPRRPSQQKARKQGQEQATQELKMYAIRYHKAEMIHAHIQELLGGQNSRISFDPNTNSLILFADGATQRMVEKMIQAIDVPTVQRKKTTVYRLRSIAANDQLAEVLRLTTGNKVEFAFDIRTNSVIVAGEPKEHELVQKLLEQLDQPPGVAKAGKKLAVRVVWLVANAGEKIGTAPPKDLEAATAELSRIGIKNLRMTAQMLVSASNGNEFMANGRAELKGPIDIVVAGILNPKTAANRDGKTSLKIQIDAASNMPNSTVASLETTIDAPLGHVVVLGVTPMDTMTSVFMVQVIEK